MITFSIFEAESTLAWSCRGQEGQMLACCDQKESILKGLAGNKKQLEGH